MAPSRAQCRKQVHRVMLLTWFPSRERVCREAQRRQNDGRVDAMVNGWWSGCARRNCVTA